MPCRSTSAGSALRSPTLRWLPVTAREVVSGARLHIARTILGLPVGMTTTSDNLFYLYRCDGLELGQQLLDKLPVLACRYTWLERPPTPRT